MLVFAAGITVPLVLLALAWRRFPFVRGLVRPREVAIGRWRNSWSAVVGGALTSAVGLLLVTGGTASLSGVLGASDQFRVESWVMRVTAGAPDALVVAGALVVLAATWGATRWRR